MQKSLLTLALFATVATFASAGEEPSCWIYKSSNQKDVVAEPPKALCVSLLGSGSSLARATSFGFTAEGFGGAVDAGPGCEAKVNTANANGWYREEFKNDCGPGQVWMEAEVEVDGVADLIDADCAAAAVGFAEVHSNVLGVVNVAAVRSMGETSQGQLGGISGSFSGVGLHVPALQPGTGEGKYTDAKSKEVTGSACVNDFSYTVSTEAYIKVWANGVLLQASCLAEFNAHAGVLFVLDDCPV